MMRDLSRATRARLLAVAAGVAAALANVAGSRAAEMPAAPASTAGARGAADHASSGQAAGNHASRDRASGGHGSSDHASADRVPASGAAANPPERPVTTAPPGAVALPRFRSALDAYRPYRVDEPLRPWREINDEVGRLGGHAGALAAPPGGHAAGDAPDGSSR